MDRDEAEKEFHEAGKEFQKKADDLGALFVAAVRKQIEEIKAHKDLDEAQKSGLVANAENLLKQWWAETNIEPIPGITRPRH